jgi:hypothetical protein
LVVRAINPEPPVGPPCVGPSFGLLTCFQDFRRLGRLGANLMHDTGSQAGGLSGPREILRAPINLLPLIRSMAYGREAFSSIPLDP